VRFADVGLPLLRLLPAVATSQQPTPTPAEAPLFKQPLASRVAALLAGDRSKLF
jgi:hypothetical protein